MVRKENTLKVVHKQSECYEKAKTRNNWNKIEVASSHAQVAWKLEKSPDVDQNYKQLTL